MPRIMERAGKGLAASLLAVMVSVGCTAEDWTWNWGQNKEEDKPRAVAAKPTTTRPATATRSTRVEAKPAAEAEPKDPQSDRVNAQIAEYTQRMKNSEQTGYRPNDLNSKIARQQDPNRRNRARQSGSPASELPPASKGETTESRPSALTGEATAVKNTSTPTPSNTDQSASVNTFDWPPVKPLENKTEKPATGTTAKPTPAATVTESPRTATGNNASSTTVAKLDSTPTPPPVMRTVEPTPIAPSPKTEPSRVPAAVPASAEKTEKPPVLEEVKIAAGAETNNETEKKVEPDSPRLAPNTPVTTVEKVDTFTERLRELETRIKKDPNNIEDQYRLRLMYFVMGQPDKATATIEGTNSEVQNLVVAHLQTLMAAQARDYRDPALSANQQLEQVESLRTLIRAKADLQVPKVVLCTAIEGFGRYTPIEPAEFKAGQKNRVLLYLEVDNFRTEKTASGMFRTLLSVRESLLTRTGEELWSMQDANIEDLARQQRRDFYLTIGELTIPKTLTPGEYVLKVEVEDVLAGKINSSTAKFKIVP